MSLFARIARNRPGWDGLALSIWLRLLAGIFVTFAPVMILSVATLQTSGSPAALTFRLIVWTDMNQEITFPYRRRASQTPHRDGVNRPPHAAPTQRVLK